MDSLFEPASIKQVTLGNRFVRAATWDGLGDPRGAVTDRMCDVVEALARGGVGLIITGHAFVLEEGRHSPGQIGAHDDGLLPGLERLASTAQRFHSRIALQLGYGGAYLSRSRVAAMSVGQLRRLAQGFGAAARRAHEAGFDAVEILAAHGFFLSQMLCPRYNPRTDEYGGALVNRARALVETLAAVRTAVGDDFPVLVKLNGRDGVENGLHLEESVAVARMLENGGADAIEVSGGLLNVANLLDARSESGEAYFETEAKAFKAAVNLPVILTGGIRSLATASRLVAEGVADFIAMCRPLICEPGLVGRWSAGDTADARCVDCSRCVEAIKQGRGPVCEPVAPVPLQTFFPQETILVPSGQSPEQPTGYQMAIGLDQCQRAAGFVQVIRVQPMEAGQPVGPGIAVPVANGQASAVLQALQELLKRFGP